MEIELKVKRFDPEDAKNTPYFKGYKFDIEESATVLDSLIIDRYNDPNSKDTGRRLAKMYINEIMSGRYEPMPNATAFPNHTVLE